jgi:protein-disulfide isomerase
VGSIAMTVFSGYLMYVLATQLKVVCPYCIASALFSLSMLVITLMGRTWEDIGQILFTALIVAIVTLVGTLGVYADAGKQVNNPNPGSSQVENPALTIKPSGEIIFDQFKAGQPDPLFGWQVTTRSGEAEIALANHIVKVGAKEYTAFWCHHCHEQKLIFGKEASKIIEDNNVKVECAAQSPKGKPEDCQAAKVQGFPTWIINGKQYSGVQNLNELAKVTGYTGPSNFKYFKAKA